MIDKYVQKGSCGSRLSIVDCFEIEREGEAGIFNPDNLGNKKLLWHGSRFSNFVGILSQGMRIAPPEAPCSGYNFGKGVYFADLIGKSYNYCCPGMSNGIATLVLCEVACGNPLKKQAPDHESVLPNGYNCTWAYGREQPDQDESIYIDNGNVEVPLGKVVKRDGYMGCNEWVVYTKTQIKMRYLVRVRVH